MLHIVQNILQTSSKHDLDVHCGTDVHRPRNQSFALLTEISKTPSMLLNESFSAPAAHSVVLTVVDMHRSSHRVAHLAR